MAESKSIHLLVAAFDFGTTYSGYAFSFRNDPLKVQTNQSWIAGSEKLISLKTPTCILLSPEKEFHSFGFEAENKYANLAEDEEHKGWLLFRRFKMLLHKNKALSRTTTVEDINGDSMPAMTIFTMAIRFLRDHLLNELDKQVTGIEETDIKYVITVPAIWDDSAKQFMRESAIKAGMDTNRLKLALEPEAASIWCQNLTTEAKGALSGSGTQYMVVDVGGGTADISVHEKNKDGTLKELHKASGGPWGGMYVDKGYMQFLEKLFGINAMEKLKKEDMADFFDVLRDFETKKRSFRSDTTEPVTFRISASLKEISEKEEHKTFEERVASLNLGKDVVFKRDKMRIQPLIVKNWFDDPIDKLVTHICGIVAEPEMARVGSILLVGGFGESQYVQEKIKKALANKRLIIPNESGLVVLKGAVRYGQEPALVSSRVMNFTYGVKVTDYYDESKHPASAVKIIDGQKYVNNLFYPFVSIGETVVIGYEAKKGFLPFENMQHSTLVLYRSVTKSPIFIYEPECEMIGQLQVELPEGDCSNDKSIEVIFMFGDTELIVKARILATGKEFFTILDCLK